MSGSTSDDEIVANEEEIEITDSDEEIVDSAEEKIGEDSSYSSDEIIDDEEEEEILENKAEAEYLARSSSRSISRGTSSSSSESDRSSDEESEGSSSSSDSEDNSVDDFSEFIFTKEHSLRIICYSHDNSFSPGDSLAIEVEIENTALRPIKHIEVFVKITFTSTKSFKHQESLKFGLQKFTQGGEFPLLPGEDYQGTVRYKIPEHLPESCYESDITVNTSYHLLLNFPVKKTFGYHNVLCTLPVTIQPQDSLVRRFKKRKKRAHRK